MLDKLVEVINDEFFGEVKAKTKQDVLFITDYRVSKYVTDFEILEDSLHDVLEFITDTYDITLGLIDAQGRTVALEVVEY